MFPFTHNYWGWLFSNFWHRRTIPPVIYLALKRKTFISFILEQRHQFFLLEPAPERTVNFTESVFIHSGYIRMVTTALLLLTVCPASSSIAECRYGPTYEWDSEASPLLTDTRAQDTYIAAALHHDGKFAAAGLGTTAAGLTCDHVNINADGTPGNRGLYTAASKESLHIAMLALVVNR